ncbi:MAG: Oxidoreductase, N-terminal [Magnetococcales bacterium]|nr:Oxidoreductase, N-terminal [Magnetococcales bacterium]
MPCGRFYAELHYSGVQPWKKGSQDPMEPEKLKIGIVGAGFMSQVAHIVNFVRDPGCHVVALAELRPQLGQAIAAKHNIPQVYPNHQRMLEDAETDAVVVITPRSMTGPIALDCLNAGKAVFTEKPLAADTIQGKKLVDAARHNNVILAVGYMRLADAGIQMAKHHLDQLMTSNELGKLTYVRTHCFQGEDYCNIDGFVNTRETVVASPVTPWATAPDWIANDKKQDYARFLNVYCHNINLMRYFLGGKPRVDYAAMDSPRGRLVVFDFNGIKATLEAGQMDHQGWDENVVFYFERGRIRVTPPPALLQNLPAQVEIFRGGDENINTILHSGWSWAFKRQASQFVDDVRHRRIPRNSGDDALMDLAVHEEIWKWRMA